MLCVKSIIAELVIVDCVSMFYEERKGGENYRKKNKFLCKINGTEKCSVAEK